VAIVTLPSKTVSTLPKPSSTVTIRPKAPLPGGG
jgi:hypothetical protein